MLEKPEPESPLERVKKKLKPMLVSALDSAQATTWNAAELYIEFAPELRYFSNTLSDPKNTKFLADACREVTGKETEIRIVVKDPRAETAAVIKDDEKKRLREMAESSPVVKQALKTFRGEIVDVKRADE